MRRVHRTRPAYVAASEWFQADSLGVVRGLVKSVLYAPSSKPKTDRGPEASGRREVQSPLPPEWEWPA